MDISSKKVLIVGFGRSGQAAAKHCRSKGAIVTITDEKLDGHPAHLFDDAEIVVVSPGVPLTLEGIERALRRGVPVICEMELALGEIAKPIIAITGTNGKSTVTTLIGNIIKEEGMSVCVGGNLGTPFIEMLDDAREAQYVVLEVSSYQLETTPNFHPKIAVLLNITEDHMDRYPTFDSYVNAKALITKNLTKDDYLVFNGKDSEVARIAEGCGAETLDFLRLPSSVNLDKAVITGRHNRENMMAAAVTAGVIGCKPATIQRVFENFPGLPHRNQFVREIKGVKYYDDSKGTNVGAVVKSLEGFDSKVVLIAGGLDKGGSYDPLKQIVKQKVRAVILIGAAKEKMASEFKGLTDIVMAGDMAAAVREAAARAAPGDAVLLSPACASFDMFKDYAHRGDVFVDEVRRLNE